MSKQVVPDRFNTHAHRLLHLFGYVPILAVTLRRRYDLSGGFNIGIALFLLGLFTLLYASEAILSRRIKSYPRIYFALRMIIVQSLGVFREYQDTWALLYIVLGFQVVARCSRKVAAVWFSSCSGSAEINPLTSCWVIGLSEASKQSSVLTTCTS